MRVRIQNSSGDMTFGNSLLNFYIDSPDGIAQLVQTYILLWLGEWYLDITDGTPFLQGILGKHSQDAADTVIQSRVNSLQVIDTNGNVVNAINQIDDYSSTLNADNRKLSVTMKLNTIYGPTLVEIANYELF